MNNVQTIAKGLSHLVEFATKTPMRKYGSSFFTLGFGVGFFTGRSTNATATDIITGAAIVGTVFATMDKNSEDSHKKIPS
jgi:mannose/fructose/N-acetylgalactosamine-specific phosphotransferase system component IIC